MEETAKDKVSVVGERHGRKQDELGQERGDPQGEAPLALRSQIQHVEVGRKVVADVPPRQVIEVGVLQKLPTVFTVKAEAQGEERESRNGYKEQHGPATQPPEEVVEASLEAVAGLPETVVVVALGPQVERYGQDVGDGIHLHVHREPVEHRGTRDQPLLYEVQGRKHQGGDDGVGVASARHRHGQGVKQPEDAVAAGLAAPQPPQQQQAVQEEGGEQVAADEEELAEEFAEVDVGSEEPAQQRGVAIRRPQVRGAPFRDEARGVREHVVVYVGVPHQQGPVLEDAVENQGDPGQEGHAEHAGGGHPQVQEPFPPVPAVAHGPTAGQTPARPAPDPRCAPARPRSPSLAL